jgi:uncharacterized protein
MSSANATAQVTIHRGSSTLEAPDAEPSEGEEPGCCHPAAGFSPPMQDSPVAPLANQNFRAGAIRSLTLPGPAGQLEAVLNEGVPDAPFAALVCHPHPLFGGNLHNKVVYHAMKAFNGPEWGLGWPVLRFNFRGAGRSQGRHDGLAETSDVLSAIDWLAREFRLPLVVAGFSFGSAMVLRAAASADARRQVRAAAALGLPIQPQGPGYHYAFLQNLTIPKLFLSGDGDEFSTPDQLAELVASAAEPKRLVLLPGGDHFFVNQLEPMQRALAGWLKEQLP